MVHRDGKNYGGLGVAIRACTPARANFTTHVGYLCLLALGNHCGPQIQVEAGPWVLNHSLWDNPALLASGGGSESLEGNFKHLLGMPGFESVKIAAR